MGTDQIISRRKFLRYAGLTVAGATLAACAPTVPPTAAPAATAVPPTAAPAAARRTVVPAITNTKKKPEEITICHSTFLRGVGYFNGIEKGMKEAGKRYGCKIILGGPTRSTWQRNRPKWKPGSTRAWMLSPSSPAILLR